MATETWKALADAKGEYQITMYDINDHFVKPWTRGTGCSIALLMNAGQPLPAEGMFSHAWAGSVVETYNCLQNMVNHHRVPATARFFFCTLSMYQPQDNAPDGLSIAQQIALEPFAKVIASQPRYGMFVLHTTVSEVYERLWVAHEADVGISAEVPIKGLFDMYRWRLERFDGAASVKTAEGKCGVESDRQYIDGLIRKRGGYERIDQTISEFRGRMREDLRQTLSRTNPAPRLNAQKCMAGWSDNVEFKFDWRENKGEDNEDFEYDYWHRVQWRYSALWAGLAGRLYPNCEATPREDVLRFFLRGIDAGPWESGDYFELQEVATALPLGTQSFPFGAPRLQKSRYGDAASSVDTVPWPAQDSDQ